MLKSPTNRIISSLMSAMITGVVMVLSSLSVSALSTESNIVVHDASSLPAMYGIRQAQSNSYGRQNRGREYRSSSEQKRAIRSRSEVMQEVKRRYRGAEVLKIALNRNGTAYNVRVLMPNGKVRSLQVSALR